MDIININRFEELILKRLSIKTNWGHKQLKQLIKDAKIELFEEAITKDQNKL